MNAALTHFFAMGGYGAYVWAAYGFTAVVLGLNAGAIWWTKRRVWQGIRRRRRQHASKT